MWDNFLNFIKELQDSDDARKRRWLIIFSAPAILTVLIVWSFMLKTNFNTSESVVESEDSSTQLPTLFREGVVRVSEQFGRGFSRLGSTIDANLWSSTELNPEPSQNLDFVLDSVEPIKPQKFHGN